MMNNRTNTQNKMILDANGLELIFPDIDIDDTPSKGDIIHLVDKDGRTDTSATGERLLPNADTIFFKNGVVTNIVSESQAKKAKSNKGHNLTIISKNKEEPYKVGNTILVDGKIMRIGNYRVKNIMLSVSEGKIVRVNPVNKPRSIFKQLSDDDAFV